MYNHKEIEQKWQNYWQEHNTFKTSNTSLKPKYYVLDMFPYPSGAGLHVGHPEGYTANDIVARYKHAKGYNVLHPMGWDAFGLPAENFAIKEGIHPHITTQKNIATFKRQIQSLGFSYDWEREIDTTDPKYFAWTQWIFLRLFEHGLAYEQDLPINYCPSCKTGLANEEVLGDFSCERCGTQVEKKKIRQWVLAITKYADRLLSDVDDLDWPEGIKDMQRNWIGKSEGCEFEMKLAGPHPNPLPKGEGVTAASSLLDKEGVEGDPSIRVYTTRVDTVFGMTYAVIAPDHPDVQDFITQENKKACEDYIKKAGQQSDQDRTADDKEKTGVFTGSYVINPYNNEEVPLWIADYVLGNYGTGAVMAVPAHDERDFEFAKKFGLEIKSVVAEYNVLTGESIPRDDFPTRIKECSTAIVKHPTEEQYLVQDYSNGELCFTGGGIEGYETPIDCIIRELKEESGIHNLGSRELLGIMVGHGFKERKQTNCKDPDYIYYIETQNLDGFLETSVEGLEYRNIWLTKQELLKNKRLKSHHRKMFTNFLAGKKAFTDLGILMNSGEYNGLTSQEAKHKFTQLAEEQGFGHKKINYKLRDWLFSRQRYWGEPIPLIHISNEDYDALPRISDMSEKIQENTAYIYDKKGTDKRCRNCTCGDVGCAKLIINGKSFSRVYDGIYGKIICDYNLPLELPEVEAYEPAGDGQSPLVKVPEFVHVELAKNLKGKRETNTMPQWGGSCWYYLRFMDNKNPNELVGKEIEKYWGSVDSYVGGAEHAVLHLLYARFWHKFLYDIGVVSTTEPFYRLRNQGMILGMSYKNPQGKLVANDMVEERPLPNPPLKGEGIATGYFDTETGEQLEKLPAKMSKSLKNVINPDDIVQQYGADTLRLYEMYMGDFADTKPWDTTSIIGLRRFLDKVYNLFFENKGKQAENDDEAMKMIHKTIKKVGSDIENYKFNTAIAQMMICLNYGAPKDVEKQMFWKDSFVKLLHPFAPHMAEEIWEHLRSAVIVGLDPTIQSQDDVHSLGSRVKHKDDRYLKVYFATSNDGKVKRAQSVLDTLRSAMSLEKIPELVEVEETGSTPMECALEKLEAYKNKGFSIPVMTADTAVYFDSQDFDPTKVRRTAIEQAGKKESELTDIEIAQCMVDFYSDIAKRNGGALDFYYIDSFAVLFPNGEVKTYEYRREYTLTNQVTGEINPNVPMRCLYISKVTGKREYETTMKDYIQEFACQGEAFAELFSLNQDSIFFSQWPKYEESMTIDSEITIGVQVLGKLRGDIQISVDEDTESVLEKARTQENVAKWIAGKEIIKEIYVPGKIVNIVIK